MKTKTQKEIKKEMIKSNLLKVLHIIGYASTVLLIIIFIVTGVNSCKSRSKAHDQLSDSVVSVEPNRLQRVADNSDSSSTSIVNTGATIQSTSKQDISFKYTGNTFRYKEINTGEVTNDQWERYELLYSSDVLNDNSGFEDGFLEIQPQKFSVYYVNSEQCYGEFSTDSTFNTSFYQYSYTKYVVKTTMFNMKYNYNFDFRYFYHFDTHETPLHMRVKCASAILVNPYHDLESQYYFNIASESNSNRFFTNYNALYSNIMGYSATTYNEEIEILRDGATYQDSYITDTQNYYLNGALMPGDVIYMVTCNEVKFLEYPNMGHYDYDNGIMAYGYMMDRLYQFGYSYNYYSYSGGTEIVPGEIDNGFSLLAKAFTSLGGIFTIQILPGITLGTLFFLPLVVGVIIVIFKMVKR